MCRMRLVLCVLGAALLAASVANAASSEELEATLQQLKARIADQDKRIAELQDKQSATDLDRIRREEIINVIKGMSLD